MSLKSNYVLGFILIFVFSWIEPSWPLVYLFLLLATLYGGLKYGVFTALGAMTGALLSSFIFPVIDQVSLISYLFLTIISVALGALFRQERTPLEVPDISLEAEPPAVSSYTIKEDDIFPEKEDIPFELRQKRIQLKVSLDVSHKLDVLMDFLFDYIKPHSLALFFYDAALNSLKVNKFRSQSQAFNREGLIATGEGLVGWIAKIQKPLHVKDTSHNPSALPYNQPVPVNSFLGIPIFAADHFMGILALDSLEKDFFQEAQEKILNWCGREIIQILQGAEEKRLFLKQVAEISLLYEASQELNASLNENVILDSLAHTASRIVGEEKAAFLGFDAARNILHVEAVSGYAATLINHQEILSEHNILNWVVHHRQALRINNLQERGAEIELNPLYQKMNSGLALPLFVTERLRGILLIASRQRHRFNQLEQETITILANLASFALNKAEMYSQMKKMAVTDGLTSLYNHQYFEKKLAQEIARARRYQKNLSLILLDIDHFKIINDTYGHPVGDEVLRCLGGVLNEEMRDIDIASRYGGEEFALILPETDIDNAYRAAERLRKKVEAKLNHHHPIKEKITISLGVGTFPQHGEREEDLVANVDQALYGAKNAGRNQSVCCKTLEKEPR